MYALEWDPLEIEFPDPWIKRRDESVHDSAKQKMIGCILCGKQRDRMVSLGNLDEKENVVFSKEFSQELEKNPIYSEKREISEVFFCSLCYSTKVQDCCKKNSLEFPIPSKTPPEDQIG